MRVESVWLPLSSIHCPSGRFTAMPTRSASGSLAKAMSASISLAKSTAIFMAACSSGLGEGVVGKLPSGVACASTTCMLSKPSCFSMRGIRVMPVPCSGVYTIFRP